MMNMILGLVASVDGGGTSSSSVSSAKAGAPAIIASRNPALVHVIIRFKAFIFVPSKILIPVTIKV
jgi:hypothetical protein